MTIAAFSMTLPPVQASAPRMRRLLADPGLFQRGQLSSEVADLVP